ncbi:uncharacterized protein BDV17DRAFT_296220 [Aspergillus undulatus]|uniref:uncharacterized protein n=1 Tax=Aspergillus undulatus TaxID=1810928 RepID=UPI003CCCE599
MASSSRETSKSQRRTDYFALLELPMDVVDIVFYFLPIESQVCVALSCKALKDSFSHVFEDERLAWPRRFSEGYRDKFRSVAAARDRLLDLLEDDRWRHCFGCLKLHPAVKYSPWYSEPNGLPGQMICRNEMRVVDLCPCLALTWSDGKELRQWLQNGSKGLYFSPSVRNALKLDVENGRPVLRHECPTIADVEGESFSVTMTVRLDKNSSLEVRTRYEFTFDKLAKIDTTAPPPYDKLRPMPSAKTRPVSMCPWNDARRWMYRELDTNEGECCHSSHSITMSRKGGFHGVVDSVRKLGGPRAPENWRQSARGQRYCRIIIRRRAENARLYIYAATLGGTGGRYLLHPAEE